MYCPKCGKLMEQTYLEGFSLLNPMTCEEMYECECGITYEFSCGVERYLDKNRKEIKVK